MESDQPTRVIVIGAGWAGLAAAKTYLEVRPDVSLTIIDEDSSVGGVWSASRVYPGLIADSCAAIFDYSDFPMDVELGLEDKWADLPSATVHDYLEHYTDKFDLRRRCRLNTRVVKVVREEEPEESRTIWKVDVEKNTGVRETLISDKLIVATGICSTSNLPEEIDWSNFDRPIMHSKELGRKHQLLTKDTVHRVTIVGGNKSAVDVVNMCAMAGKEVDWVIRPEGYGPGILFEARTHGIHAGAFKAARASAIPSPNILATSGFWYWFFHSGKSRLGSKLHNWMLTKLSKSAMDGLYATNENTMKIAPDMKNIFWSNSGVSVVHDGSRFMDMVAEGKLIHVHRTSILSLSGKEVHLSDGQILPCDAAVFATGWEINQPTIFDPSILPDLGFPFTLEQESSDHAKHWNNLDQNSESRVRTIFPMLANPPPEVVEYDNAHAKIATTTPFRMFRNIAPPTLAAKDDRSIIALGLLINTNVPTYAEVSALWGVAYLESLPFAPKTNKMLSNISAMEEDISLVNAWQYFRFRDRSAVYADGSVEIQDFTDLLMTDLGLRADRKRSAAEKDGKWGCFGLRGWAKEWFSPYRWLDYQGFVAEYKALCGIN